MKFEPTRLQDVLRVDSRAYQDERGFFMETWEARKFAAGGVDAAFVQDNYAVSRRWVLRGLHYQLHQPQGKLVRVTRGEAFDVAVDVRRSSRTFGQWVAERLSADNRRMLWIPPGFAHGYLALSDQVDLHYKCTDFYDPKSERALLWNDPALAIQWPLPAGVQPIVSAKDLAAAKLADCECPQ